MDRNAYQDVLSHYNQVPEEIDRVLEGTVNENIKYRVGDKWFVLTKLSDNSIFRKPRQKEDFQSEISLMRLFSNYGINVITPVQNNYGEYYTVVNGQQYRISEFYESESVWSQSSELMYSLLGELMAKCHCTVKEHQIEFSKKWTSGSILNHTKIEMIEWKRSGDLLFLEDLAEGVLDEISLHSGILSETKEYPIHADIHFDNILYVNGGELLLLDFDNSRFGHISEDIAITIIVNLTLGIIKGTRTPLEMDLQSFFTGYLNKGALTQKEINLILLYMQIYQARIAFVWNNILRDKFDIFLKLTRDVIHYVERILEHDKKTTN